MRIVKAEARLIDNTKHTPYQMVETAGRICYKSEANITPESAVTFVKNMIKNNHTAMLEHGVIHLMMPAHKMAEICAGLPICEETSDIFKYITTSELNDKTIVTASLRTFLRLFTVHPDFPALAAWRYIFSKEFPEIFPAPEKDEIVTDMMFLNDEELKTMVNSAATDDEKKKTILMYHLHHTVLFTCDRGVSHELVRHRVCAFAQESTRYCNYAKNKFNNEITVIEPVFFLPNSPNYEQWKFCCETAEKTYMSMLENGATPQEARTVLPNSLKTEIVVTACEQEWQHIVNLRYHGTTGKPHPQMLEVMLHAYPQLVQASDFRIK